VHEKAPRQHQGRGGKRKGKISTDYATPGGPKESNQSWDKEEEENTTGAEPWGRGGHRNQPSTPLETQEKIVGGGKIHRVGNQNHRK